MMPKRFCWNRSVVYELKKCVCCALFLPRESGRKRTWFHSVFNEIRCSSHDAPALNSRNRLYRPSNSVLNVPVTPSNGEDRTDTDTGVKCDAGSELRERVSASDRMERASLLYRWRIVALTTSRGIARGPSAVRFA